MKKFLLSVAVIFLLLGASNVYAAENFAVEVLNLVNAERAKVGVAPLRLAKDLQEEATIRAQEIVRYFSHTRPDGSDCFTVMRNRGRTCGENIAAGQSSVTENLQKVIKTFMFHSCFGASVLAEATDVFPTLHRL